MIDDMYLSHKSRVFFHHPHVRKTARTCKQLWRTRGQTRAGTILVAMESMYSKIVPRPRFSVYIRMVENTWWPPWSIPRTGPAGTILVAIESNEKAIAVLGRRRSEILERCGKLFSFHNFAENTSAALAPRAGISQPILLLFFLFSCSWICLQNVASDFFYSVSKFNGVRKKTELT